MVVEDPFRSSDGWTDWLLCCWRTGPARAWRMAGGPGPQSRRPAWSGTAPTRPPRSTTHCQGGV